MTQIADADLRELKTSIEALTKTTEANAKAIETLTNSFTGFREDTRVEFATIKGQINTLDAKFDERSKGIAVLILSAILLTIFKSVIFGTSS